MHELILFYSGRFAKLNKVMLLSWSKAVDNKNVATKRAILKDGTAPIPQEIQICTLNWHECIFFFDLF